MASTRPSTTARKSRRGLFGGWEGGSCTTRTGMQGSVLLARIRSIPTAPRCFRRQKGSSPCVRAGSPSQTPSCTSRASSAPKQTSALPKWLRRAPLLVVLHQWLLRNLRGEMGRTSVIQRERRKGGPGERFEQVVRARNKVEPVSSRDRANLGSSGSEGAEVEVGDGVAELGELQWAG